MDVVVKLLIALHLLGLVIGMGSGIALSLLGRHYALVNPETRSLLYRFGNVLSRNGHIGLGLLWVTGIAVVVLEYGGVLGMNWWFWVKIALVVVLSASFGIGSAAYRKLQAGDKSVTGRLAFIGKINMVSGVLIIISAVFAFA